VTTETEAVARGPERVEAFSDGVFAIAITLLVLDIRLPAVEELSSPEAIVASLGALWPSYLGYLVSFITIGNVWINHHNLFRLVGSVSHGLLLANLFLLLGVGFMPFPTALLADTLGGPGQQIGVVIYAATFVFTAVAFNFLWFAAKRVLRRDASPASVEAINRSYRLGPPITVAALVIAFVNPVLGMAVIVGLMLLFLLPRSSGT
jgi:uncharacterized membrane protein